MPVTATLYPYQEDMLSFPMERDKSLLLASPGLGKTLVTLKWLDHLFTTGQSRGSLVIAPLRVARCTWPEQIETWSHSSYMSYAFLHTPEGRKAWHEGKAMIYLINPEQLIKCLPLLFKGLNRIPVDTLVIDEIANARNPKSKRFKALLPYLKFFKHRVGLTGTPIAKDYRDLWAQVRLIDDGERLGKSYHHYVQTWFDHDYMKFKFWLKPGAKEQIDAKLADIALVMLGDDYLDVPTTMSEDVGITLPPEARKTYTKMEKDLLVQIKDSEVVALSAAALTTKLLQLCSGSVYDDERNVVDLHTAKVDALRALRKKHKGEPMLVFIAYRHERARLLREFPDAVEFDENKIKDWQAGRIPMFVCSPQSMGHGVDGLQRGGRICVWFTMTWSSELFQQACARLIRTGQSWETLVYRLVATDTIDEAVCESVRVKGDTQSGLLHALKALQNLRK